MAKVVEDDEQDATPSKSKVSSTPNSPLFTPKTTTDVSLDAEGQREEEDPNYEMELII